MPTPPPPPTARHSAPHRAHCTHLDIPAAETKRASLLQQKSKNSPHPTHWAQLDIPQADQKRAPKQDSRILCRGTFPILRTSCLSDLLTKNNVIFIHNILLYIKWYNIIIVEFLWYYIIIVTRQCQRHGKPLKFWCKLYPPDTKSITASLFYKELAMCQVLVQTQEFYRHYPSPYTWHPL